MSFKGHTQNPVMGKDALSLWKKKQNSFVKLCRLIIVIACFHDAMPLMLLFHDTKFWYHALIGQRSSFWQNRGAVDSIVFFQSQVAQALYESPEQHYPLANYLFIRQQLKGVVWELSYFYGGPEGSHMQTKNFTRKLKMLLQIKNRTCKLKIVHAN